jgi:hypothetical protein
MCDAIILDKSLCEIASKVMIDPQNDGSIVISAVQSNITTGTNTRNLTYQPEN